MGRRDKMRKKAVLLYKKFASTDVVKMIFNMNIRRYQGLFSALIILVSLVMPFASASADSIRAR
jgi:hypothetical protein